MNLKIPKDKAIEILKRRIIELSDMDFNAKAWKDKTVNDLREIFPIGSMQWLQISNIRFDTYITSDKHKVLQEAKDICRRLLNSYIEFIENYSTVAEKKEMILENNYQKKYNTLLTAWNELIPQWNDLLEKHRSVLAISEAKDEQIDTLKNEMVQIKENTIQFDNISLSKVLKAIKNLPVKQLLAVIAFFITIIVGSFKLGLLYQENSMNADIYQLNKANDTNQQLIRQKDKQIEILQKEITKLKQKGETLPKY